MKYHTSPHSITGKTLVSMMFNRKITTRLSLLLPDKVVLKEGEEEGRQDRAHNFDIDDPVWARVYSGKEKWNSGKIVEKYGPRNYKVLIGQHTTKQHVDQLRYRYCEFPDVLNAFDDFLSPPEEEPKDTLVRYPSRDRRPPN